MSSNNTRTTTHCSVMISFTGKTCGDGKKNSKLAAILTPMQQKQPIFSTFL